MFALHMAQRKPSCDNLRIFWNGFALMKSFANAMLRCTTLSKKQESANFIARKENYLIEDIFIAISCCRGSGGRIRRNAARDTGRVDPGPRGKRRVMSIKTLMSAAYAAGFAMAAEDVAEPLTPVMQAEPARLTVPARIPQSLPAPIPRPAPIALEILRAQRALRRFWLRMWLAGAWGGRAAA